MDYRQFLIENWDAIDKANAADYPNGVDSTGYRAEKHIAYLGDYDPAHMLNLYYPEDFKADKKIPTVIYIHGGGWMYGNADISERYLGFLASCGYAVMAMNYTLLQNGNLSVIVKEIYSAMHWLEKYGPARGFDLGKVLVCGDSAGGHLSVLTTCISLSEKLQEIYGVKAPSYKISAVSVSSPVVETSKLYINGEEGTDLYFKVSLDGAEYTFTVESYLCGADSDVYKAVKELSIGDVIDMEGFLYWYEGVNPHITSVSAAQ